MNDEWSWKHYRWDHGHVFDVKTCNLLVAFTMFFASKSGHPPLAAAGKVLASPTFTLKKKIPTVFGILQIVYNFPKQRTTLPPSDSLLRLLICSNSTRSILGSSRKRVGMTTHSAKMSQKAINAGQHLTSLGWAGPGHALDSHTSNRGLSRPLLVTHKQNTRGLGSRTAKERQADQWWLNAFDAALRQANTTEGKSNGLSDGPSALDRVREYGVGKGGLYGWFKRGEVLGGTFDEESSDDMQANKRKREATQEKKSSRRKVEENQDSVTGALIPQKKRNRSQLEPPGNNEDMLPTPASTSKSASPSPLITQDRQQKEEEIRRIVKAELKRRKRAGEFTPPQTLNAKEQKKHAKALKRETRRRLEVQLFQEHLNAEIDDLTLSVDAEIVEMVTDINIEVSTVTPADRRRLKLDKKAAKSGGKRLKGTEKKNL